MKNFLYKTVFLLVSGLVSTTSSAIDLAPGSSQTIQVKVSGTITQKMSCTVNVDSTVNVAIPQIEYKDIKTEEDVAAIQPLMTVATPSFTSFSTAYNKISTQPGYAETPSIGVSCEYGGGQRLLSVSLDPSSSWNAGNSDLLLSVQNAPGVDAQGARDYSTVLRLATFLYVTPANQSPTGHRLDLANMANLNSKITPFAQGNSSFKLGFLLYKRTVDKSNGFSFANWRPPVQSAPFVATLPIILNFN